MVGLFKIKTHNDKLPMSLFPALLAVDWFFKKTILLIALKRDP